MAHAPREWPLRAIILLAKIYSDEELKHNIAEWDEGWKNTAMDFQTPPRSNQETGWRCSQGVLSTGATPAKNTANAAGALRNALTACNTLEGTKRFSRAVWISAKNGQNTS